jgi:hypothetical protein
MTITRSFRHRIVFAAGAVLLAACSSSSDGGGTPPLDESGFGARYKLADNEVAGWTQDTAAGSFATYNAETIFNKIDGAAPPYLDRGMRFALWQQLKGPDPQNCTLVAMDMTSEANAKSMVAYQQTLPQLASTAIPGYDASVAIGAEVVGGIQIYACFKALYLEVGLDGFGADSAAASQAGVKFLQAEEGKTK